ncbi:MAG TPA: hypothetical protein VFW96_24450, partial [Thermomicrobiales bacterium]|nr:hypothetical protein [Thermomicrobiales bacterium]
MPWWLSGVEAGLAAGAAMALVAMWLTWLVGQGALLPLRLIGAAGRGRAASTGGPAPLLAGALLHTVVAVLAGLVLAALLYHDAAAS